MDKQIVHYFFVFFIFSSSFQSFASCPTPVTAPATPALPPLTMFTQPTLGTWSMSTGVSIVREPNGTVWCAGSDQSGELGDGIVGSPWDSNNEWQQVLDPNIQNIRLVDNGINTNVALRDDGTVWAWGDNWVGKIGDGTYALGGGISPQPTPQQVIKSAAAGGGILTNVVKVMSGYNVTVALTTDHKVYAWGYNSAGQFGPSFTLYSYHPSAELLTSDGVNPINWAMDVDCGDDFIVILRWNGTVWTMGDGASGQLGNSNGGVGYGSIIPVGAYAPGVCTALTGIKSISAGRRFVLAVDSSGTGYGWGLNNYGQTGTGNAGTDVYHPQKILGAGGSGILGNINQVEAAGDAGYAVSTSGNLYSWGSDQDEELGDGPGGIDRQYPQMAGSNVTEVQAGLYSVLLRKTDGTVCAAGNNWFGNFGLGGAFGCCGLESIFICVSIDLSLPIELINFEGHSESEKIILEWTTASEINNDYFTVLKSKTGTTFEPIGTLKGSGNSTQVLNYSFPDLNPYPGINYYMLRQTDFDGQESSSKIIFVYNLFDKTNEFIIVPNPAIDFIQLIFPGTINEFEIEIRNTLGEIICKTKNQRVIHTSSFHSGIYYISILSNDTIYFKKFSKL